MYTGKSYVINLERRPDRLERFVKFYYDYGPNIQLNVIKAIDGINKNDLERVPEYISSCILDKNDYENKNSVRATSYSHMLVWKMIAESEEEYGIIFEDDCYFRQYNDKLPEISKYSLKHKWDDILQDYSKELEMPKSILFFGVGDLLPIHTNPPCESILVAQEYNHVLKSEKKTYYGKPNFKSPYVFDWIGTGAYIISKNTAKYLLAVAQRRKITTAIDAWIKKLSECDIINLFFTIPLFGYFPNMTDSNTIFPDGNIITT